MKKFIVDRTELLKDKELGFSYIGIFDENGNDWYEEQKNFEKDTLKIMYNKDTLRVSSKNKDVSMLAPTMAGDVVEEIESDDISVNPNQFLVGGKLVELQTYEKIENGAVVFNKEKRIDEVRTELSKLKVEYSEKAFEFEKNGVVYLQKNRDLDKSNLTSVVVMMTTTKKTNFKDWKFKDVNDNDVYVDLTIQDMLVLADKMQNQTTKAMRVESELIAKLEILNDEEIKEFKAESEFEELWNLE